jgi:hypothetical protein
MGTELHNEIWNGEPLQSEYQEDRDGGEDVKLNA